MEDKNIEAKETKEIKETKKRDKLGKLMEKIVENKESKENKKTESKIKAELHKMNRIFKKVSDKYLLNEKVKKLINDIISSNKEFKEEFEKDT